MAYALSLNGGAIQIPKITFAGDFSVTLKATQQANGRFFCGGDNTAGSIEIYRNNSGIVALYIGTVGQFSGATVLSTNVDTPDTIVVARSGSSVTVRVNGTLQGTATFSGNMHISWLGLRQSWGNYPATMRLYFCDMQDLASPSNSRYYDPSLSGGTGNVLPTTAGTNAGAQFGSFPTDDSEWVFYSSGSYSLTAEGGAFSYSGGAANTLLNRILSADGREFPYGGGNTALIANRKMNASGAAHSYSGAVADTFLNRSIVADGASFSYAGGEAATEYTEITGFVLVADGAEFSCVGGVVNFKYTQNFPNANPEDFTVTASIQPSPAYSSRISPDAAYNVMMQSDFKFNGRLN